MGKSTSYKWPFGIRTHWSMERGASVPERGRSRWKGERARGFSGSHLLGISLSSVLSSHPRASTSIPAASIPSNFSQNPHFSSPPPFFYFFFFFELQTPRPDILQNFSMKSSWSNYRNLHPWSPFLSFLLAGQARG